MKKQKSVGLVVLLVVIIVVGVVLSLFLATVQARSLFDEAPWLVWIVPFVGLIAAGFTKRRDPEIEKDTDGERVLRHDNPAIVEHWSHGLGTTIALVSGVALGLFFIPVLVPRGIPVRMCLNLHYFSVLVFLFGTFYYAGNSIVSWKRVVEHLPTKNAFKYTVEHYGHLLGFKKYKMPPEKKYFESEKMAYLIAVIPSIGIIVTGFFKVATRTWFVSGEVMSAMTFVHDLCAVVLILFLVPHLLFSTILPSAWPVFKSMVTGYVSRDYAEEEHRGWIGQLTHPQEAKEPESVPESDESKEDRPVAPGIPPAKEGI